MRISLLLTLSTLPLAAQCSDGGLCALERLPRSEGHRLGFTYLYGTSGAETGGQRDKLQFNTFRLEGQFALGTRTRLGLTLPFQRVSGPDGATAGLGDAVLLVDHQVWAGGAGVLAVQAGARVPLGRADARADLPQAYQPSLGTTDVLAGLRFEATAWGAGLGYQRAGGRSENPLTRLQRADELLLWGQYGRSWGDLRGSLMALFLKPLGKASVQVPDSGPARFEDLLHSDQPQLNLVPSLTVPLVKGALELSAAVPLLKRDTNVDGLKRALTVSMGYSLTF